MRVHQAIITVSAILAVFGLTLIFFSAPFTVADASAVTRGSMDISEMQRSITNLPVEKLHDMTFVFSD
jgi:hypothetical protein